MSRSNHRQELGKEGEARAAEHLRSLGWTIVTRRFRTRGGEIDIIALDGDELVFVEVKARREGGEPEAAVNATKMKRLASAGRSYLAQIGEPERPFRIDIVAIEGTDIRHHRRAGSIAPPLGEQEDRELEGREQADGEQEDLDDQWQT